MNSALRTRLVAPLRAASGSPKAAVSSFPTRASPRFSSSAASPASPSPSGSSSKKRRPSVALRNVGLLIGCGAIGGATYDYFTSSGPDTVGPLGFVPLKLAAVEHISPDTAIFKLAVPKGMKMDGMALGGLSPRESVVSVWVKQPELQIQRAYTPLEAGRCFPGEKGEGTIDLLVKRYADGELSRWIHRLSVGDEVGVRGPVLTWATPDACEEVVFIVGGTGVTPAYQFAHSALATAPSPVNRPPKITIVYSSPTPLNIYLKKELDALASANPERVSVRYLVDQEDGALPAKARGWWPFGGGEVAAGLRPREDGVLVGRAKASDMGEWIGRGSGEDKVGKRVVVVCGPEGMVTAIAGPRARDLSQGPIGGILGELGYGKGEVVKL